MAIPAKAVDQSFDPIRPLPPLTTIFMLWSSSRSRALLQRSMCGGCLKR